MMRSEIIPPVGTQLRIRRMSAGSEDLVPAEVVAHLNDPRLGDVLELRPLGSRRTLQRVWPSPTLELPPAV
jgi:hypothetical protein